MCRVVLCCVLQVLLLSLLDLPFSISPVVTGLMLMLLYGRAGWFAQALAENGLTIVFAFPGACVGVCGVWCGCISAHASTNAVGIVRHAWQHYYTVSILGCHNAAL